MAALHNPTLRVTSVLNALYKNETGLTLTELSNVTKIPKGTLHPIVLTLLHTQFLKMNGNKFQIGKSSFQVGTGYFPEFDHTELVKKVMNQITHECDEICQLGVLDGGEVLYIAKVETQSAIRLTSSVGHTLNAYATAIGRALLSCKSDDEIRALYPNGLVAYTPKTTNSMEELLKKIELIRKSGISSESGETNPDIGCIAVALQNVAQSFTSFAAISVSVPLFRLNKKKSEFIKTLLLKKKEYIEQEIAKSGLNSFRH
ncbi:IclR family transcriptional regulator [Helicobacter sp. 11S02629-2]|uniref:IclR family transcriptional regulator n=1 Tax=Helicobacter sp. 11S02629-2 TaxID=1476195 RepID=UPI000BA56DA0|nr:IclR family transcriptional regulator [Helicobacter sp. 11S02629-2]PAF44892.1 hypothetical protein BKH40_04180 [Helicobacter sp. 11S02629-2]